MYKDQNITSYVSMLELLTIGIKILLPNVVVFFFLRAVTLLKFGLK